MTKHPVIEKADGSKVTFNPNFLVLSLRRAGAGEYIAQYIAQQITDTIVPGISSKEIYARAFSLLRKESRPIAAHYALRKALLGLGPTGHPFEDFISHLYVKEGWKVETRKMIKGKCVTHETDFYASHPKQNIYIAAELKYHNKPNYKTDLKVALYVKSRFDDIFSCDSDTRQCPIDKGLLVTNTKFTSEAIAYAECAGVELLGWGYPEKASLFIAMTRAKVYPITTLTRLSQAEKRLLINTKTSAVDQIVENRARLDILRVSPKRIGEIIAEAEGLLELSDATYGTLPV